MLWGGVLGRVGGMITHGNGKKYDFKRFIELNRDKLYANAENANDITLEDEWMQDDQWDEIYKLSLLL